MLGFVPHPNLPHFPAQPFESIEAAREWVQGFVQWYNTIHCHSAIKFVTPSQRHRGEDITILKKREAVYRQAKQRHPARWSGKTRDWTPIGSVWLNPDNDAQMGAEN